jgi:hypothetical protein
MAANRWTRHSVPCLISGGVFTFFLSVALFGLTAETDTLQAQKPPAAIKTAARVIDAVARTRDALMEDDGVKRFHFRIAANTPLQELLPVPPKSQAAVAPLTGDDLSAVPEVVYQEPWATDLPKEKALEKTALAIARVNHLNRKKTDAFIEALVHSRPDLAGLPFAMGDACRTKGERRRQLARAVDTVRQVLGQTQGRDEAEPLEAVEEPRPVPEPEPKKETPDKKGVSSPKKDSNAADKKLLDDLQKATDDVKVAEDLGPLLKSKRGRITRVTRSNLGQPPVADLNTRDAADLYWQTYQDVCNQEDRQAGRRDRAHQEAVTQARVAALVQVLGPESPGLRLGLVKYLSATPHVDATHALARLALFTPEEEVRTAAVDALKLRRERDYTDLLLQGFRYPLPAVAKRAGEALTRLERKDLVPQLVSVLDQPDPRAPVLHKRGEKQVPVVRELVRVNHHRSCLLCHAPGNTPAVAPETLTAAMPVPGEPLPSPSEGYNRDTVPDILVRVDVTYLRQDFSALLPVADANPWPEMQRFDFLVRTRELSTEDARTYEKQLVSRTPGAVAPHRRAALAALRELTGQDTAPTATAWRQLLKLTEPGFRAD